LVSSRVLELILLQEMTVHTKPHTYVKDIYKTIMIIAVKSIRQDNCLLEERRGQAPVAHACNPSYAGGRGQEDCDLKPAQANSS
jgi:hypothetical protein